MMRFPIRGGNGNLEVGVHIWCISLYQTNTALEAYNRATSVYLASDSLFNASKSDWVMDFVHRPNEDKIDFYLCIRNGSSGKCSLLDGSRLFTRSSVFLWRYLKRKYWQSVGDFFRIDIVKWACEKNKKTPDLIIACQFLKRWVNSKLDETGRNHFRSICKRAEDSKLIEEFILL
jgi:hypothetical protein